MNPSQGVKAGLSFVVSLGLVVAAVAGSSFLLPQTPQVPTSGQLGPWMGTSAYPFPPGELSCVASQGYAYCVGGYDGTTPQNGKGDLNRTYFAPLESSGVGLWTRTTDYPIGIQGETCVANSGYIYCIEGYVNGPRGHETTAAYYAPLSTDGIGAWRQTTPLPYPSLSCTAYSGYVYCLGVRLLGNSSSPWVLPPYDRVAYFAPLSASGVGNWMPTNPYPQPDLLGCVSSSGHIFCFGEQTNPCSDLCPVSPSYAYFAPLSSNGIGSWVRTADLPTDVTAAYVLAGPYLYYLSVPLYFASVSSGGLSSWGETTNYPDPTYPSQCVPDTGYVYCIGALGGGSYSAASYYSKVGAPNPNAINELNPPPFANPEYLGPALSYAGSCSVSGPGVSFAGSPCNTININDATVFHCLAAAATSSGCATRVLSPGHPTYDYNITIWYPYSRLPRNVTEANCAYQSTGDDSPLYAWCISIGPNSFIVSVPPR